MAVKRRPTTYQYEPLVTPSKWQGDELRFSVRLTQILDDLYQKFSSLRTGSGSASVVIADDANKLGGIEASKYALKTGTVANANKLGGKAPEYYLSPRNLLDNSDFTNPINQRGATSYVGNNMGIDRWQVGSSSLTLTINSGSITLKNSSSSTVYFIQKIAKDYTGKTVTLAAKDSAGNIYCGSAIMPASGENSVRCFTIGSEAYGQIVNSGGYSAVRIAMLASQTVTLEWIALYEGEYTAETLPSYAPKEVPIEKANCGHRFIRLGSDTYTPIGMAQANESGALCCVIPLPYPINIDAVPTIMLEGKIAARSANVYAEIGGILLNSYGEYQVSVWLQGSNFDAGKAYDVFLMPGSHLSISRDL